MAMVTRRRGKMREFHGPTPHSVAILARPPRKNPVDKIILESRKREDEARIMKEIDDENIKTDIRSEWERRSEKRIERCLVKREVDALMKLEEFDINDRREKLRKLLHDEEEAYTEEMLSKEETVLEKQAKMRDRAKQLKDRKEKERLAFCQDKYDQQFRQNCEEVRSTLAKRTQDEICVNRIDQLREKEQQRLADQQRDQLYNDMWKKDFEEKAAREEREAKEAAEKNRALLGTLQKQMAALEAQKKLENELKQEEARLLEEEARLLQLEEQNKKEHLARQQASTRDMLDSAINLKSRMKQRRQQEELAFDLKQLEQLMKETEDEEAWQRLRKAELREEDRKYRDYLQYMSEVEKLKEKEFDKRVQKEVEKDEAKKAEKVYREREARHRLLNDVLSARHKQLQDKIAENARKQEEAMLERRAIEEMIAMNKVCERQEAEDVLKHKLKYKSDLAGQISYKNCVRTEEVRQELDELDACRKAEEEYRQKITDILSRPLELRPHPMVGAILQRYDDEQYKDLHNKTAIVE